MPVGEPTGEVARFGAGYDADPGAPSDADLLPAWAEVSRQWAAARNYWVITVRPDGRPHAAPVWGIWWAGTLWFGTGAGSVKGRNLAADPRVTVHLESGDEVAVLEGTAAPAAIPAADRIAFADAYEAKYSFRPDPADGMYRVQPITLLTWTESVFPNGKFRWRW